MVTSVEKSKHYCESFTCTVEYDLICILSSSNACCDVRLFLTGLFYMQEMTLSMLNDDMHDFVALIEGYYHLYVGIGCTLQQDEDETEDANTNVNGKQTCAPAVFLRNLYGLQG